MTARLLLMMALLGAGVASAQSPFSSIPPARTDALRFGAELPAFEVKDIAGRTWRLDDLLGKHTLLYVWHTFPARTSHQFDRRSKEVAGVHFPDLREVERVYREVKRSKDIQVLTLCTDYDYTHAPEYMKEMPYTFPVIADWVLIRKLLPEAGGHGMFWVVNPEGRLSEQFRSWSFTRLFWEVQRAVAGVSQERERLLP